MHLTEAVIWRDQYYYIHQAPFYGYYNVFFYTRNPWWFYSKPQSWFLDWLCVVFLFHGSHKRLLIGRPPSTSFQGSTLGTCLYRCLYAVITLFHRNQSLGMSRQTQRMVFYLTVVSVTIVTDVAWSIWLPSHAQQLVSTNLAVSLSGLEINNNNQI